jgi:hypothetical protein
MDGLNFWISGDELRHTTSKMIMIAHAINAIKTWSRKKPKFFQWESPPRQTLCSAISNL